MKKSAGNPQWFTIELAPGYLNPETMEWLAHEGQLPEKSRQLSSRRIFTVHIFTMDRETAIMDARRIHGAQQLQTRLRKGN